MPSRSFTFSLVDKSVPQFRASFEVTQHCQDGDEQEVSVSTAIKQTSIMMVSRSKSLSNISSFICFVPVVYKITGHKEALHIDFIFFFVCNALELREKGIDTFFKMVTGNHSR